MIMTVSVRKDSEQDFSLPVRSVLIVPERIRTRLIRVTDSASKVAIVRTTVRANKAISPVRAASVRAIIRVSKATSPARVASVHATIRVSKATNPVRVASVRATIRANKAINPVRAAMEEEAIRPIKAISHKASVRVQPIRNII